MQALVSVEFSDGLTFAKIWERSRPPLQFMSTAPASGECELYLTAVSETDFYTFSVTIDT